ncbi:MAG: hypothetical protein ACFNT9_05525 [Rodentibacter sp.]
MRLQCPLDIENGNVWLDMWAKDRHNNTVVKREIWRGDDAIPRDA